ncbi:lipopolysaccharide core heptose(II) kinase RfaY [Achaetomium macrosporum]|uniref:Lipopolysaccharide core heptose(II) kinase RfaY n=1 Tax=Achaetomium macrosporum TaxID=79813 RepID=A0AAN7C7Q3_9PEZI|nr:lipopolysaccharide core heptose(II) kinase RfaY [Achaetomium macrosporum]
MRFDSRNKQKVFRPPATAGGYEIILPKLRRPGEPENYRICAARLDAARTETARPKKAGSFWFRTRYISAFATELSHDRPHLLHLHICPSLVASFVGYCFDHLPAFARSWFNAILPEWFLPDHLVLKTQKQGEEASVLKRLFDTEVKAYDRLRPPQGVVIPKWATLKLEELSALLQPCYRAVHAFKVQDDDPQLGNFQLVDGKIMVLDFERVMFDLSEDDNAHFMKVNSEDLALRYVDMQEYYLHQGSLEAA